MGTVICSSSRLLATLVLLSTRPTLSLEDTASWRRPMARLFSLAVDRLRRSIKGWERRPVRKYNKWTLTMQYSINPCREYTFAFSKQRHCKAGLRTLLIQLKNRSHYSLRYAAQQHRAQNASCQTSFTIILLTTWLMHTRDKREDKCLPKPTDRLSKSPSYASFPQWKCYKGWHFSHPTACSCAVRWSVCLLCGSVPDVVASSMSLLLALRISSFFSVSSSARQQMISPL